MPAVFISYRRDDSAYAAHMIRARLAADYGPESVFMDIDSIPLGVDFRHHVADAVSKCDVFIAIIGQNWVGGLANSTTRRIDHPNDFVRMEIEAALSRGIPLIPVLVGNAQPPRQDELPSSLSEVAFRNAAEVRSGKDAEAQLSALSRGIGRHFAKLSESPSKGSPKANVADVQSPPLLLASVSSPRSLFKLLAGVAFVVATILVWRTASIDGDTTTVTSPASAPELRSPKVISSPQPKPPVVAETQEPAFSVAAPVARKEPPLQRSRPVTITDVGQIRSTYQIDVPTLRLAGIDESLATEMVKMSHETQWPEGINTFGKRAQNDARNRKLMQEYKGYLAVELNDVVVIRVPADENQFMVPELRPTKDFYISVGKEGVRY